MLLIDDSSNGICISSIRVIVVSANLSIIVALSLESGWAIVLYICPEWNMWYANAANFTFSSCLEMFLLIIAAAATCGTSVGSSSPSCLFIIVILLSPLYEIQVRAYHIPIPSRHLIDYHWSYFDEVLLLFQNGVLLHIRQYCCQVDRFPTEVDAIDNR